MRQAAADDDPDPDAGCRAAIAIAIKAAPPNTMLMPTKQAKRPECSAGQPGDDTPARIRSMMPLTSIHSHWPVA